MEGGGAVGASGRRRGDGAAGQKKRRPAAPQGGSGWTEQQAVVGNGQGGRSAAGCGWVGRVFGYSPPRGFYSLTEKGFSRPVRYVLKI